VAAEEAARVAEMVAAHVALADIEPGTRMDLRLGRRADTRVARPLDMLAFRARFDLKLELRRGETGRLAVHRIPIAVDNRPLRIQGYVGRGLYHAARAAGGPPRTVAAYLKALATQIDVGRITGDDRFDIIVEHSRAETGETRIGELLYAGLDRSVSKDLQLIQWQQGGRTQWFEASGVGQQRGELQKPVPGPVSSGFGIRRHPILGYARMHRGVDFRASYGTPVRAATDGRVTYAGWNGGYGRHVKIKHDGGLATSYSHLSRFAVASGQHVRQGEVIGYVGSTGLSTGAHLHYEMYRNGRAVDPRSVSYITRALLSGEELARFRAKLAGLLAIPAGAREAPESRLAGKRGDAPDA
ncbi:MAG: peptidoglycan DD-metalloendopeptidase family protein, partial [Sphingomonadaceae bacterium]